MYVNNVRLYAKHLRRDLAANRDGLPEPAHRRLLLQGVNGSGKSTFLETIATLWNMFGEWIEAGLHGKPPAAHLRHEMAQADVAAVELHGLLPQGRSLWIGVARVDYWVDLKDEHPDALFAGLIHTKGGRWEIQLPEGDWRTFRERSLANAEPQPNVVYFPPERQLVSEKGRGPRIVEMFPYLWSATYSSSVKLESLLLTLRATSPPTYDHTLRIVNQSLDNERKEIVGFVPDGLVVRGRTEFAAEYDHPLGALSSGEQQMLLLIGFVAATLKSGGIVVIDEPDLHIHSVMVQQLLGSIEAIVRERRGQLIVAAHSEDVANWFALESERLELKMWRGASG